MTIIYTLTDHSFNPFDLHKHTCRVLVDNVYITTVPTHVLQISKLAVQTSSENQGPVLHLYSTLLHVIYNVQELHQLIFTFMIRIAMVAWHYRFHGLPLMISIVVWCALWFASLWLSLLHSCGHGCYVLCPNMATFFLGSISVFRKGML